VSLSSSLSSGAFLAEPAIATASMSFAGSEYFGSPAPLTSLTLALPAGTGETSTGFATCSEETLRLYGPIRCPAGSQAGPITEALLFVTFGGERVEEHAEVSTFVGPDNTIDIFLDGHNPVSLEIFAQGVWETRSAPLGPTLHIKLPEVASVPGAPYASFNQLTIALGTSRAPSLLTVPVECPTGKFNWASEAVFAENGEEGKPLRVEAPAETTCPSESPTKLEETAKKKTEEEAGQKRVEEAIQSALGKALVPSGKSAKPRALLKADGLRLSFTSPGPGSLVISWYDVPKGAHLSSRPKPILVATGATTFATAGVKKLLIELTKAGRRSLTAAKKIKLTAKGTFTPKGKAALVVLRSFTLR
jgi:hypothetical protein